MNLFERLGFNAPQAASTAQPIGQDEFGRTIYRDSTGATYAMGSQPVQRTDAQRNDQVLIDAGIFPPDPADPRVAVNALATSLLNGFTAPGNALRGQPVTLGDVWETAGTAALGSQAMPAPQNSLRAFNVYHGSPHDFDKFSMDKIGTGEGAQGQGHGLYFAGREKSAKYYADTYGGDSGGKMYEVTLDANPNDFVDWNRNIGDMPAAIKEKIRSIYGGFIPPDTSGMKAHAMLKEKLGSAEAVATALRDSGVPGIKYQGAGASKNYVVFDENLISIVRKYGWAAAAPMLAQMGMTPEQAQAQYAAQNGS